MICMDKYEITWLLLDGSVTFKNITSISLVALGFKNLVLRKFRLRWHVGLHLMLFSQFMSCDINSECPSVNVTGSLFGHLDRWFEESNFGSNSFDLAATHLKIFMRSQCTLLRDILRKQIFKLMFFSFSEKWRNILRVNQQLWNYLVSKWAGNLVDVLF